MGHGREVPAFSDDSRSEASHSSNLRRHTAFVHKAPSLLDRPYERGPDLYYRRSFMLSTQPLANMSAQAAQDQQIKREHLPQ